MSEELAINLCPECRAFPYWRSLTPIAIAQVTLGADREFGGKDKPVVEKPDYYRPKGRIYLYPAGGRQGEGCPFTQGTFWDLEAEGITPRPGMRLQFYADDGNDKGELDCLLFTGIVQYDEDSGEWYALIDDDSFCHESDLASPN